MALRPSRAFPSPLLRLYSLLYVIRPVPPLIRKSFALLPCYTHTWLSDQTNRNTELPFLVAHLHLHAEDGTPLDMETTGQSMLYGSTVSSAQTLRNLLGSMGSFFVFPDVSISIRGRYILRITLMRLPRQDLSPMPCYHFLSNTK